MSKIDLDEIERTANWALSACEVNALGAVVGRYVPALMARVRELEGIIAADDERLRKAGESVGLPFGCDTAAVMADRIKALEALLRHDSDTMDNGWVKDADGWYRQCPWCEKIWTPETDIGKRAHRPDCPWLAAMGEE